MNRRHFVQSTAAALAAGATRRLFAAAVSGASRYRLTLGQWSFHRAFRGEPGFAKREGLEFPGLAGELGFEGVDYSGILLGEHHADPKYLAELNRRAAGAGVKNVLILVDLRNPLGARTEAARHDAVAKFRPWLPAAKCVCAKAHDFDANGDECYTDFQRMLRLVADSGYRGWFEVEYEGPGGAPRTPPPRRPPAAPLGEREGTLATKRLLQRILGLTLHTKD